MMDGIEPFQLYHTIEKALSYTPTVVLCDRDGTDGIALTNCTLFLSIDSAAEIAFASTIFKFEISKIESGHQMFGSSRLFLWHWKALALGGASACDAVRRGARSVRVG